MGLDQYALIPLPTVDMASYRTVLANSSAGKDSQAMLTHLVSQADMWGVPRERIVVVHADLGRVEWPGTRELAQEQAEFYGLRFEVVRRDGGDLLDMVEERGMFPGHQTRWCTSELKTQQVKKLMTRLAAEHRAAGNTGPLRILNCLGIRAEESVMRARKPSFARDPATNGRRIVDRWFPIFEWSTEDVWDTIHRSGVRYHWAYDLGMPRLSCAFCFMAKRRELVLSAKHNPELGRAYVRAEEKTGHRFRADFSMADVLDEAGVAA